jgi:hypothetical protein
MERSGRVISAETEACQFTETADAGQILLMSDEEQLLEVRQRFDEADRGYQPRRAPHSRLAFQGQRVFSSGDSR